MRIHRAGLTVAVGVLCLGVFILSAYWRGQRDDRSIQSANAHATAVNTRLVHQLDGIVHRLSATIHQEQADRDEARAATCNVANDDAVKLGKLADSLEAQQQIVVFALTRDIRSEPRIEHAVTAFNSIYTNARNAATVPRDCTPAGIAKFYRRNR